MDSERTRKAFFRHASYSADRRSALHPVEAILFDRVELSGKIPDASENYDWLTAEISRMGDDTVARKMKKLRDSFPTLEDALAEKIMMEAI